MKVFDKRPLSLILCILLGSFVFFTLGATIGKVTLAAAALILIILSVFIKKLDKSQKISLILFSSLIIIASLLSYVYFDLWFYSDNRYQERCEIAGTVESIDFDTSYKTVDLDADSINDDILSGYKLKVVLDETDINNISIGTKIKFTAILTSLSSSNAERTALYAEGFSSKATEVENLSVIGYEEPGISYEIYEYRSSLARRIVMYSDAENGGLLAALLLGDQNYLSAQTKLDFSRIGISHILALSGMHLVIICFAISKFLSFLKFDKKSRKIFEIVLTLLYMGLTGFSVSVVRAGLMLIISALLFLICGSKDSLTNLFISVSIILLVQPYALYDLSIWLSAFATLGIIVFSQITRSINAKHGIILRVFKIFMPLLSSAFAIIATLFISSLCFESVSLFSIVTTSLFSPLIFIFMHVGLIYLFTASFIPLGEVVIFIGNCITDFAHFFSGNKYALLSSQFSLTQVLMISASILFVLFLIVEIRKRKAAVCVILILFLGSLLSSWIFTANQISNFSFCYDTTDDKERIFISENSELCLIDINEPKVYNSNKTVNYLKDKNILYLDNYFVTSYNDNSVDSLRCILSKIYIENLYLPLIKDDDRGEIFENVLSLKNEYKTNFIFYEENEIISFESFSIVPVYYDTYGKCAITISYQDEFYTYVTADMLENDTAPQALKVMNGVNTVIVGNIKKTSFKFIYKLTKETKLIYNKKTGLTDEILAYYENRILVDPNGAVELYVE